MLNHSIHGGSGDKSITKWIPGISWGRGGRPGWAKAQAGKERDTGSSIGVSTTPVVGAGGPDEHSDHRLRQGEGG